MLSTGDEWDVLNLPAYVLTQQKVTTHYIYTRYSKCLRISLLISIKCEQRFLSLQQNKTDISHSKTIFRLYKKNQKDCGASRHFLGLEIDFLACGGFEYSLLLISINVYWLLILCSEVSQPSVSLGPVIKNMQSAVFQMFSHMNSVSRLYYISDGWFCFLNHCTRALSCKAN